MNPDSLQTIIDSLQTAGITATKSTAGQINTLLHNFTILNVVCFILAFVSYFMFQFKLKSTQVDFKWGYWIKDNWYNVVGTLSLVLLYFIYKDNVTPEMAIAVGLSPNIVADWFGQMIDKAKKG